MPILVLPSAPDRAPTMSRSSKRGVVQTFFPLIKKSVNPFCYYSQGHKLNLPQLLRSGRRKPSAPFHFCLYTSIFMSSSIGGMGGSKCCGGHSPGSIGLSMHPMSR